MTKNLPSTAKLIAACALLFWQALATPAIAQTPDGAALNGLPPLQIVNQTGLKVVVQVNENSTIPNGVAKQVLAAKNLLDQYQAIGMKPGQDFEIAMVFRGDGAQFLLTDAAYDEKVAQPHGQGNPNRKLLDALAHGGVTFYECGVAMRMKGYVPKDIRADSRIVVSGMGALVDFQKTGYIEITP
jgi:intracellular sulfur oxidation DsrE/DsrF family protein